MIRLQFLGASGGVTGSSYLITGSKNTSILVDLGMFQGESNNEELNSSSLDFDVHALDAVFLTHAHLDHCGRLPLLFQQGFTGVIYTTDATKDIAALSLLDAAVIQEDEPEHQPLYTKEDVERTINAMHVVTYDATLEIGEFTITIKNAGHILGSASIVISDGEMTFVFSGDLGNIPAQLIQPPETIGQANIVIMESTYGDRTHPQENAYTILQKEIAEIESKEGVLLIPAFSIERSQEVLHILGHLIRDKKINSSLPVFLDSPMAIEVTDIFKKFPQLYSQELSQDNDPFEFPNLICTKSVQESKRIVKTYGSKIIIAGSGMMNGGRILHHLNNFISEESTRLLIVGYQAEGTLGREILEGAKEIEVYGEKRSVRATITKLEAFSSHADQLQLLRWLETILHVQKVFLVHGDDPQRKELSNLIQERLHIHDVLLPMKGQQYEID